MGAGVIRTLKAAGVAVLAAVGTADEAAVLDEDGLAAAERWSLRVGQCSKTQALELGDPVPQPFLQPDRLAVDAEARAIEGGLRVETVIYEGRDKLKVGLRLDEPAHDSEWAVE
jgi:hypothetical protein